MTVTVLLFAQFRDVFGSDTVAVPLPETASVAVLRLEIAAMKPEVAALLARSQVAVNGELVGDEWTLQSTDEIALIPPVSGG